MASRLFPYRLVAATTIGASGSVESPIINSQKADPEVLMLRVTSVAGAADVRVQYCISNDGITFNSYTSQDDLVTSTATEFAGKGPEEYHALVLPLAPWMKVKVTDVTAALVDTIVDLTLWSREL